METECTVGTLRFQAVARRAVQARFDGGALTSDGGAVLLREVDRVTGLLSQFAACFRDARDPARLTHPVAALVRQRVYALALGYEDLNDHDRGSTSLGSEVDILVGMAASPINANARALSPVGRVEGLEGFVVVYDKQTHEWTRVGQHEIRDALEAKDEDLERAIIKVATAAGPTFKSQFRTRLRDGGVCRRTDAWRGNPSARRSR